MTNVITNEELKNDAISTDEPKENQTQQKTQEVEFSDFEKEQIKLGWDPNGKKSAEQWSADYPLFKKIAKMERLLENMTRERQKAEEFGYKKALDEFEQRKQEAVAKNDVGEYNKAVKEEEQFVQKRQEEKVNHPAIKAFEEKYRDIIGCAPDDVKKLAMLADMQRVDTALGHRNLPTEEHIAYLDKYMQETYGLGGEEAPASKPLAVESNTRASMSRPTVKKYSYNDLSKEQKEMADYLKKTLNKSHDDYIADLVKFGDLK